MKSHMHLFIDPKKYPKDITWAYLPDEEYILIRAFDHFVRHIETNGVPKFISMDCELGKDCAKWLGEYCQKFNLDIPSYMVHSKNKIEGKKVSNILAFYIFSKNDKK